MAVLLLAEVTDGELAMDATAKAVTAAGVLVMLLFFALVMVAQMPPTLRQNWMVCQKYFAPKMRLMVTIWLSLFRI